MKPVIQFRPVNKRQVYGNDKLKWPIIEEFKPWVEIDAEQQIAIETIGVWEIDNGVTKIYRISKPGLGQNTYYDRVMIRGKQRERHILAQYESENTTMNMYPATEYLSLKEQEKYSLLLKANNIRGCIDLLRNLEKRLNLESEMELQHPTLARSRKKLNRKNYI